jgi:N-acyl-D-amino-acid deacylase
VDGTGNPWFPGDLGIEGDKITAIGDLRDAEAHHTIDATGQVVAPGIVDSHSHSDRTILINPEATSSIYQGVTTEIVGNCGMTFAPITPVSENTMEQFIAGSCPGIDVDWRTFGELLDRVAEGTAINLGVLVGHSPVRRGVLGTEDRQATEEELEAMADLVEEALDAGAIGLSFGLEFMPGRVANAEEVRRLCAVAAKHNKMTAWHVRNRDRKFIEAVQEAVDVTRSVGVGLHLAHLSAKPGSPPRAWNQVMEIVRLAREEGHDVQCDMIPYTTGPGLLATILPNWATQGPIEEVQTRLRDPAVRERLKAESDRYWFLYYYREWDKLSVSGCRTHPEWVGMTLREIGEATGRDPFDIVYDILADEGETLEEVWMNGVLFSEGDIIEWLSDPLFSIASDGMTVKDSGPSTRFANHPTNYGWTPTVIQKYVNELRAFSLETAIHKMTAMPASRFGIYDRGLLRENMKADVIVFDEKKLKTRATFENPFVYAEGMDYVFVNGQKVLDQGMPTGELPGQVLGR